MTDHEEEARKILERVGAVITDTHVVYTSGNHGSAYVNKDAVLPHTGDTSSLCRMMAEHFLDRHIAAVLAPAVGGVALSQWLAYHLSGLTGLEVLAVYADKTPDGEFIVKRGYDKLIRGRKTLIVEDVINTGVSVRNVIRAGRAVDADIVGVAALCNRGGATAQTLADVPELFSLLNVTLDAWNVPDCRLCAENVPINTDVGHGREFLASQAFGQRA